MSRNTLILEEMDVSPDRGWRLKRLTSHFFCALRIFNVIRVIYAIVYVNLHLSRLLLVYLVLELPMREYEWSQLSRTVLPSRAISGWLSHAAWILRHFLLTAKVTFLNPTWTHHERIQRQSQNAQCFRQLNHTLGRVFFLFCFNCTILLQTEDWIRGETIALHDGIRNRSSSWPHIMYNNVHSFISHDMY